jgi:MFS family permease
VALFAAVARRSLDHQSPVIDPAMVRIRGFSIAVAASLIFFVGFAAMLLSGVLFTTGVWGEDVLTAGLMLAPGPAMAATFSIPSARLASRLGYRATGLLGSLLFALAAVWWLTHVSATPDYAGDYLPGMLVSGIGVGLLLPTLTGAGAASLPAARFSTGIAVVTMGRQIGSALGVAVLVALLGSGPPTVTDFHGAWWLMIGAAAGTGATLWMLGAREREPLFAAPAAAVEVAR